jgi:ribosomal protein S19E (S16A)
MSILKSLIYYGIANNEKIKTNKNSHMNEVSKEITKQLQAYIDELVKHGQSPSLSDLNMFLQKRTEEQNIKPQERFHGFSPVQMHYLLDRPFEEGCPIQLKTLKDEEIEEIPFMKQALYLMRLLDGKELKLTPQGYIPPKLVSELYGMGLEDWNSNYYKQKTEQRVEVVRVLHIALKSCGFIKIRTGKMSLTSKGKKLLNDGNTIFHTLMYFMFMNFNVAYFDSFEGEEVANIGRLYSLWLLHHYGEEWHNMDFYAEKYFKAFPDLLYYEVDAYGYRTFNRLFHYIGICEINDTDEDKGAKFGQCTRKRDILDKIFSFTEPDK